MHTDWLLVRRLAAELDERFRGGRIATAGLLPDGRFALDLKGGRAGAAGGRLIVDAFAPTPLAWLASPALAALDLRAAPGWSRAMADSLEGRRIEGVRGRTGDRLIAIDARARSRFGVDSDVRLVLELVPKFGNVVLLKDQTIIAAAREFEPAAHGGGRTSVAGGTYEPPPLPEPRRDPESERLAFVAFANGDAADVARALRRERPLLPPALATSLAVSALAPPQPSDRALASPRPSDGALRATLLARADTALERAATAGGLAVYRDGAGRLAHAHLLPLAQCEADTALARSDEPAFLPLVAELAERVVAPVAKDSFDRRRRQLSQRLERRRRAVTAGIAAAERERLDDGEADRLRRAGEALYARATELAPGATRFEVAGTEAIDLDPALDAHGNAAAIFKRYRKVANRRTHAERRLAELAGEAARLDEIAWELARAEPETLPELARAIDEALPTGAPRDSEKIAGRRARPGARPASLKPHRFELGDGARLLVGRSPHGNAEVTFRLARPDDVWFHVRGVPGAHVVLQLDEARAATPDELRVAAETAAAFSSAAEAERVDVDLTLRKHVRKRDTGPGQVWYVNASTLAVRPRRPASSAPTGPRVAP